MTTAKDQLAGNHDDKSIRTPSASYTHLSQSSSSFASQIPHHSLKREGLGEVLDRFDTKQTVTSHSTSDPAQMNGNPAMSPSRDILFNPLSAFKTPGPSPPQHETLPYEGRAIEATPTAAIWLQKPLPNALPRGTARPCSSGQQRWQLWRIAVGEFVATTILCISYAFTLFYYKHKGMLLPGDQKMFNAITQTNTLLLGISIAAAFRGYAKRLRWLMLACRSHPLETFELILASDSLVNVFKLLYKGGRRRRDGEPRFQRYYLPSLIQVCCIVWIISKVSVTSLVGYAGSLTSMIPSEPYIETHKGNTTFTDFAALGGIESEANLSRLQTWGSRGIRYNVISGFNHSRAKTSTFLKLGNGTAAYWPTTFDTSDTSIRAASRFQIRADAYCTAYNVTSGQFGNQSTITYVDANRNPQNYSFPNSTQPGPGPGGWIASSQMKSTCGARCVNIDVFVARTEAGAPIRSEGRNISVTYDQAKFFKCNNTVGDVTLYDFSEQFNKTPSEFALSDAWARMVAGAVGWEEEGDFVDNDDPDDDNARPEHMSAAYPKKSELGKWLALHLLSTPNETGMSDAISGFSMAALTAADDGDAGLGRFKTHFWYVPERKVVLQVDIPSAVRIIGAIVFGQFMVLMMVFVFANKAVIKSDEPLSIAKLYYSLLKRHGLGEAGSLLDGGELVEKMGNPEVRYGWMSRNGEKEGQELRFLDVFDDEENQKHGAFSEPEKRWYD